MDRAIKFSLNDFPAVPDSLRADPAVNLARTHAQVNLASLFHHYYFDCYGVAPPDPDPAHFEHLKFLANTKDFRFRGQGLGAAPGIMGNRSQELGQAFCRWFLHDYLNIAYFAHMHEVLNRQISGPFRYCTLKRKETGSAPDYLCSRDEMTPYLAEAKGRYTSVSFKNKEFQSWRDQFSRVEFQNAAGSLESLKGYVVATRFATEEHANIQSGIFAEDPASPGDRPLGEGAGSELASAVVGIHYGRIAEILDQPILSAALRTGFVVPEEIIFPVVIWELQLPPLKGMRFVGGYFPKGSGVTPVQTDNGQVSFAKQDPFRLGVGGGTFVGLEQKIFRQVASRARGQAIARRERSIDRLKYSVPGQSLLNQLPLLPPIYSAISIHRDGSILAPIEFMRPIEQVNY